MSDLVPHTSTPDWQLRITDQDGAALRGAAVLVSPLHAITCAHVVRDTVDGAGPGSTVGLDAPRGGGGWRSGATVLADGWWWGSAPPWDVAVLRLHRPAPALPARIAPPPRVGARVRFVGFPLSPSGRWVTGRIVGSGGSRAEYVQIDTDSAAGITVSHGFSGCGVREERDDALLGIVCEAAVGGRVGWMIPMEAIPRVWESGPPASAPAPLLLPRPRRGTGRRAIAATSRAMADLPTLLSPDLRSGFYEGLDPRLRSRVRLDQDVRSFAAKLVTLAHEEYGLLDELLRLLEEWEDGSASMLRVRRAAAPLMESVGE